MTITEKLIWFGCITANGYICMFIGIWIGKRDERRKR